MTQSGTPFSASRVKAVWRPSWNRTWVSPAALRNERHAVFGSKKQGEERLAMSVGLSAILASVEEKAALREQVGSPFEPTHAFVAILDALAGARTQGNR